MHGNQPEFIEALRLIRKFFPEARGFVTDDVGLDWDGFAGAMMQGEYYLDASCDPFRREDQPDLGFAAIGGLDGEEDEVFRRILQHTGIVPSGRAVVVPDAIGFKGRAIDGRLPFVCASQTVAERLREMPFFVDSARDALIVFESGEAILVDHDDRLHWSTSRIRRR